MSSRIARCICSTASRASRSSRVSLSTVRPVTSISKIAPSLLIYTPTRSFSSSFRALQVPPGGDSVQPLKELSTAEYESVSDRDMDILHENLETFCEDYLSGAEVEYASGVMTLTTHAGTYVINKQPPNQQIWISSPFSGPARFGYSPDETWVHFRKEGVTLGGLLDEELRSLAKDWEGSGLR